MKFNLRLGAELYHLLKTAAFKNHRSMNAEIIHRLTSSFNAARYRP